MRYLIAIMLLTLTGCQAIARRREQTAEKPPPDLVDIGGLVKDPQALPLPESGLNLSQAIMRTGSVAETKSDEDEDIEALMFAMLKRNNRGRPETYFIPFGMVDQGVAGHIPLKKRDTIKLIQFKQTNLFKQIGGGVADPSELEIRGLVPKPGRYEIKGGKLDSFMSDDGGGGDPLANGATVATLTRVLGLTTEHYLIPLGDIPGSHEDLVEEVAPKHGDVVTFTRMENIPIVMSGFIEEVRRSATERAEELTGAAARRARMQEATSSIPGVDSLRSAGPNLRGLMPF